jgi:type II secretory pathway component PulC
MIQKNISAEEKLLRLIKGRGKKDAVEAQKLPPEEKQPKFTAFRFPKIKVPQIKLTKSFLDYSLMVASLILAIYLVIQFAIPKSISFLKKQTVKDKTETETNAALEAQTPYSYFVEDINNRQLFSASFKPQEESQRRDIKEIKDLIKDISLVGIITKQDKLVAIIEDKRVNKSYFLNEGDSLGELIIKSIQEGKVILDYYGQEVELYL